MDISVQTIESNSKRKKLFRGLWKSLRIVSRETGLEHILKITVTKIRMQIGLGFDTLEKTLESPLDSKEIKPVNPKGNQSWIFIGRTDAEAEYFGQYFGHLMGRTDSWKRPWCWESLKAEGEDREGDGWMLSSTQWTWVEQALGDGEGQGGLACCSPWGHKERDMTKWLKNNNSSFYDIKYSGILHT